MLVVQTAPANTLSGATYNWVGTNEKLTENNLTLQPTEMGARVYLASIGRFLQVDPQEGGTDNNYVYANDPVNDFDLDGTAINWRQVGKWAVIGASIAGAVACGVSVVCGIAVGAAAGAAAYAVAKGGTKQFSVTGLATSAMVGGAWGSAAIVGKVGGAAVGKIVGPKLGAALSYAKSVITRGGAEIRISSRLRISPFGIGNTVGKGGVGRNMAAELPHVHIRWPGQPASAMKLHRPWQTIFKRWFK